MNNLLSQADCQVSCPIKKTAEILEGKWTTLIIRELLPGKKRYSQIQRALEGISPRMLASRLRFLESVGLVNRTVYATVPPMTEYALTALGQDIRDVLQAMAQFGEKLPNPPDPERS